MQPPLGFVPEGFIELFGVAGRNYLHNAGFVVNQRGETTYDSQVLGTATASNFYTFDRWRWSAGSTANTGAPARVLITRELFTADQLDVEGSPRHFLRVTNTTVSAIASDRVHALRQNIEGVNRTANKNLTISFWARSSIANKQLGVSLNPIQSTNGSRPANSFSTVSQAFTLTSNWQKFTATFRVPLLSGFVIGTGGNDNMEFSITYDYLPPTGGATFVGAWGGTGTTDIALVQLENGLEPTEFEFRPFSTDITLCQRYYWRNPGSMADVGYFDTLSRIIFGLTLPVIMRAAPTISSSSITIYDGAALVIRTFRGSAVMSNQSIFLEYNAPSNVNAGKAVSMYLAGGEFIIASAEY